MTGLNNRVGVQILETSFGKLGFAYSGNFLYSLKMGEHAESQVREEMLSLGFLVDTESSSSAEGIAEELIEYFNGERQEFTFVPYLYGAEFYKTVWKALMQVPYGSVVTYG